MPGKIFGKLFGPSFQPFGRSEGAKPDKAIDMKKIDTPEELLLMPNLDGVLHSLSDKFVGNRRIASMTTTMGDQKVSYTPARDTEGERMPGALANEGDVSRLEMDGVAHTLEPDSKRHFLLFKRWEESGSIGEGSDQEIRYYGNLRGDGLEGKSGDLKFSNQYEAFDVDAVRSKEGRRADTLKNMGALMLLDGEFVEGGGLFSKGKETAYDEVIYRPAGSSKVFSRGKIGDLSIARTITMDMDGDLLIEGRIGDKSFTQKIDFE